MSSVSLHMGTSGQPTAAIADELALARIGIATVLADLGFDVVADTHAAKELVSIATLDRPDVIVVGSTADLTLADTVQRLMRLRPRPTVVALLPPGRGEDVRYFVALGVAAVMLRGAAGDELATAVTAATKGEQHVSPALHAALARGLTPLAPTVVADGETPVSLSAREREVLALLAEGRSNRQISADLSISLATVKSHLVRIYTKLDASNRNEALGHAVAKGLLS
jgi:DNA-binding NarL/FixJ family response regulator